MDVLKQQNIPCLKSAYHHTEVGADHLIFMSEKEHGQLKQHLFSLNNSVSTAVSDDGGTLLVWGCGEFGQHGHGHQNDIPLTNGVSHPLFIGQDSIVTMVACGSSHTICVTDDSRIYSWGNGNSGQLGIGQAKTVFQPHLVQLGVPLGTMVKGVACGTRHTFIWTEEGQCYSFGNNFCAQLGYDFRKPDFKENQPSPVYLEMLFNQNVLQVSCGSRHSLFLFSSGLVASVGCNDRGQLGLDSKTSSVCIQTVPDVQDIAVIGCGTSHCLAVDGSGNVYAWGYGKACGSKDDILSPKCICTYKSKSVKTVDGGDSHSMLLLHDGTLYSWGVNFEGQLGHGECAKFQSIPTEIESEALRGKVSSISVGENTSAAITGNGLLFMWGRNVSQVFRHDEGPRFCQFVPYLVLLASWKAEKVSCGSWHVACIVHSSTKLKTDSTSKDHLSHVLQKNNDSPLHQEDASVIHPMKNLEEIDKCASDFTGNDAIVTTIHQEDFDRATEDVGNYDHDKNTTTLENPEELKTDQSCPDKDLGYVTADSATELIIKQNSEPGFDEQGENTIQNSPACSELGSIPSNGGFIHVHDLGTNDTLMAETEPSSESEQKIQANIDKLKICDLHDSHEVSKEVCNTIERTCNLSRTQSEDSLVFNNIYDPVPPTHSNLNHSSESLCDFTTQKYQEMNSVEVHLCDRLPTDKYQEKNSVEVHLCDRLPTDKYQEKNSVEVHLCDRLPTDKYQEKNNGEVQPSSYSFQDNEHSEYKINTSDIEHHSCTDSEIQNDDDHQQPTMPINPSLSPSANTKLCVSGQAVGQLNRGKKPPRHLRKVPSSVECSSNPQNQPTHTTDTRYHFSGHLQRTQSNPTMNISSIKLEVFPTSLSSPPTPSTLPHVPHPPTSSHGPPPGRPGPRRAHSQKIFYSSGASWRKRNSNLM